MAGEPLVFPWARSYDADQLAAFIEDLWGAASGDNDLATLDAIEKVIAEHGPDVSLPPCPLSPRELDLLTQIAEGETYESAARNLDISVHSARARVPQIYARIGAKNGAHAVAIALRHGWIADLHIPDPFEEVPRVHGPTVWNRVYRERAAELRQAPGSQADIGPYRSRHGARGAARSIRKGLHDAFSPAGSFDASTVRAARGWIVRARYIETPVNTAQKAAS
jgi:DNA-binding CsgD family transcriptional regulator